ncbi:putative small terminase [Xanthomonas phage XAJ2]|uniref:Putative small terminase n=1 Tax=Xanthomonas phage XAJ2 TaxID=1775249 RepID=A0A1I9L2D4_9CAUD|nr:putative small terminase [Xanthomonas phage XAJ2]
MSEEDTIKQKHAYAAMLLQEPDPFKAALRTFDGDTGFAIRIYLHWPEDPIVIAEQKRIKADNPNMDLDKLADKAATAKLAWEIAEQKLYEPKDRLAALKLYAEIRNYIEKPKAGDVNVQVQQNRVMVVKDHGSDDDWKEKARLQQARLKSEAAPNASTKH